MKNDCLFCAIIDGEIPSNKVYEDEQCYAFYDIEPQAPTHFLVVPKEHICCAAKIDESNEAVVAHCFTVIAKLCRELGCDSYRIVNNCGDQMLYHPVRIQNVQSLSKPVLHSDVSP